MGRQSLLISLEQNNSVDEDSEKVLTLKFIPPRVSYYKYYFISKFRFKKKKNFISIPYRLQTGIFS